MPSQPGADSRHHEPILNSGDPIEPNTPAPFGIDACKSVASKNPNLKLTIDYLPDAGIRGNSHMMMLDRNNKQIADRIMNWIERSATARKRK